MAKVESTPPALGNWREMRPPKPDSNKDQLQEDDELEEAASAKSIQKVQEEADEPMDLTAAIKPRLGGKRKSKSVKSDRAM